MSKRTIRKNRHREDKGAGRKTWTWNSLPQHVAAETARKLAEVRHG